MKKDWLICKKREIEIIKNFFNSLSTTNYILSFFRKISKILCRDWSLESYQMNTQINAGLETFRNRSRRCRSKLVARISQPDVPKFSASAACGEWSKKGTSKTAYSRREERYEGGRQNWNFFARVTTQQLIKSLNVSLWLVLLLLPESRLFSQYKLSLFPLSSSLSIDYRVFLHSPWYGPDSTPRRPSRRCLRLATFTPRN